jgi:hypothetical protein
MGTSRRARTRFTSGFLNCAITDVANFVRFGRGILYFYQPVAIPFEYRGLPRQRPHCDLPAIDPGPYSIPHRADVLRTMDRGGDTTA